MGSRDRIRTSLSYCKLRGCPRIHEIHTHCKCEPFGTLLTSHFLLHAKKQTLFQSPQPCCFSNESSWQRCPRPATLVSSCSPSTPYSNLSLFPFPAATPPVWDQGVMMWRKSLCSEQVAGAALNMNRHWELTETGRSQNSFSVSHQYQQLGQD